MIKRRRKKEKTTETNPIFKTEILTLFSQYPFQYFNYNQVAARLGISGKEDKELIRKTMAGMLQNKILVSGNRGKYRLNPIHVVATEKANIIEGRISMKQTGKAYLISESSEVEDIFIAFNNTGHALNGDIVKVHLFPARKGRRPEGRVIEIVKRDKELFVGTIKAAKNISYFIPDNLNMPIEILIPNQVLNGAKTGQKVVAKITEWSEHSRNPFGEIVSILGYPGDNNVEMHSILIDQNFSPVFPQAVEKEASKIPLEIPQSEIKARRDFRKEFTITIDPADAKDFDDAISLSKLDNGHFRVGVHIADVSYYVKENSLLDAEAYNRATSVYLVDRTISMLPERLSNNLCSLRPHEDKLCYSAVFEMDIHGKIYKQWIGRTIINSNHRFNYEEVQQIIENRVGEYSEEILTLDAIAKALRKERFDKGSINFASEEVKFILDENAKPIGVYVKENKDSNKLVEDFMLLANRKVAALIGKVPQGTEAKSFVYRIHDRPLEEKIGKFNTFIGKLGYSLRLNSRKSLADSMNSLFENVQGKGEQTMIETLAIRTMQRAVYSTNNIGHYGLAFKYYTHFTSPIRRYPDLMVHRLLSRYLDGKPSVKKEDLEAKCKHSSDMEQRATEAERNSIKYKQAEYLSDKVGQEFGGLISGVSKWGIWVQLDETKCEGMVSVKSLVDDFYYYDEDNYRYVGQRTGKVYRLGDTVRIRIKEVDLAKKQMNFVFLEK
jgi:ribonuclease R